MKIFDVFVGIIANFFFFIMGFFIKQIITYIKLRRVKLIWGAFLNNKNINVVMTTRDGPYSSSTPRVSMAELEAYAQISAVLDRIGLKAKSVSSNSELDVLKGSNLILLGGPVANKLTNFFFEEVFQNIPYRLDLEKQAISSVNTTYCSSINNDDMLMTDYAIILKKSYVEVSSGCIIISMGCHGFGTKAGIDLLTQTHYRKKMDKLVGKNDFIAIIKTIIKKKKIINIELMESYILTK